VSGVADSGKQQLPLADAVVLNQVFITGIWASRGWLIVFVVCFCYFFARPAST
jgi:hypothetical protein